MSPEQASGAASASEADWSETFEVGVAILDQQHRELLRQTVRLAEALRDDRDAKHVSACLNFLDKLVMGHLGTEETLMDSLHYPGAAAHRGEHAELVSAFHALRDALGREGASLALAKELNKSVYGWLFKHVLQTDRTFSAFLRDRSLGRTGT